jgi:hypothetical protein
MSTFVWSRTKTIEIAKALKLCVQETDNLVRIMREFGDTEIELAAFENLKVMLRINGINFADNFSFIEFGKGSFQKEPPKKVDIDSILELATSSGLLVKSTPSPVTDWGFANQPCVLVTKSLTSPEQVLPFARIEDMLKEEGIEFGYRLVTEQLSLAIPCKLSPILKSSKGLPVIIKH